MAREKIRIPQRPEDDREHLMGATDKDCMTYAVLTGTPNSRAFGLFFPEYREKKGGGLTERGESKCKEFFAYEANKAYMADYRKTLAKFLKAPLEEPTEEVSDRRKDKALKSLFHQAMSLVEGGKALDPDTLKAATDIFKKIGLLREEEEHVEAPRRYLPVRCGECEYKKFIDEMARLGKIKKTEE